MDTKPKLMSLDEYWTSMETSLRAAGYPEEKIQEAKNSFYAGACCILLGALKNAAGVPKPEGQAYIEQLMNDAIEVQRELQVRIFNRIFGSGANN